MNASNHVSFNFVSPGSSMVPDLELALNTYLVKLIELN